MASNCRQALLLALDVSSSVDISEDRLQRDGLAAALLAPQVQAAIFASNQHIALAVYEWSGRYNQRVVLDWLAIDEPSKLLLAANKIASSKRGHNDFPTAMGHALGYGAGMLQDSPPCRHKTLDVSGDGKNNEGFGPKQAYAAFPFDDITTNGLVILGANPQIDAELVTFYKTELIRGPGAFVEIADGFKDYEDAMRRKLMRELSLPLIGIVDTLRDSKG
ncbi:MAG: DUF1194 domain-containing protein [Roseobacter sp.]